MFKILPLKLVPRDTADVNFISLNLILGVPDGNHWLPAGYDIPQVLCDFIAGEDSLILPLVFLNKSHDVIVPFLCVLLVVPFSLFHVGVFYIVQL